MLTLTIIVVPVILLLLPHRFVFQMEGRERERDPVPVDPIPADPPTDMEALAHLAATSGDGRLFKMDIDYTTQVDEALPKAKALAAVSPSFIVSRMQYSCSEG